MRRSSLAIAFTATVALLSSTAGTGATIGRAAAFAPPRIGQQAPDFTLVDQNGRTVTLSAARGEKVVLVFYRGYW